MKLLSKPDFDSMSPEQRDSYFREYVKENPGGRYRPNLSAKLLPVNQGAIDPNPAPNVDIDVSGMGPLTSMLGQYAGVDPSLTSAANAIMGGATPEQMGMAVGQHAIGSGISKAGSMTGIPGVGPMAGTLASTAMSKDPNYGKAALQTGIQTAAGVAGSVFGPLGVMAATSLTDYVTQGSWEHGFLGDITDSRRREKELDVVEDTGVSRAETKTMAESERLASSFGVESLGSLTSAYESTSYGKLDKAISKADPFGMKSLSEYLDKVSVVARQAAQTETPASFDLSTTAGAMAYGKAHGLNITDLDTAMSEARGHAGLDTIGTGVELSEREKREYGSFEVDKGTSEPGGWEEGSEEAGGFEGKGGV